MLATALPPVLPAPVAAPAPATPIATHGNGNGNGPESFARMLDAADARRQAPASAERAPDAKPAQKAAAEKTDDTVPAPDTGAGSAASAQADGEAADDGSAAATADAGFDPGRLAPPALATDAAALLAGLAALPRPATADAAGSAATALGLRAGLRRAGDATDSAGTEAHPRLAADPLDATAATATTAAAARRASGAASTAGSGADAGQGRDPFTASMRQAQADAGRASPAADTDTQRLQAVATRTTEARPAGIDGLTPGGAVLAAATGPGAAFTGAAPTVAHARLSAGPGSAEFAGQLGAQLTTFVREGVQHARLELHPLELGPVTVQIAIDGTQARVNLAAEHATTRQALEQAMPALAGSLRDAGLTLSGGGVFEQPRQPQPDSGGATSGGRQGSDGRGDAGEHAGTSAGSGPARLADAPLRRRGVVDLVA